MELGSFAYLIDVAFTGKSGFEELLGFLGLHAFPLPFGYSTWVSPGATSHADYSVGSGWGVKGEAGEFCVEEKGSWEKEGF